MSWMSGDDQEADGDEADETQRFHRQLCMPRAPAIAVRTVITNLRISRQLIGLVAMFMSWQ